MSERQTENVTTIRLSNRDKALLKKLVERLKDRTRVAKLSRADVFRMGLDCLAEKEGISTDE